MSSSDDLTSNASTNSESYGKLGSNSGSSVSDSSPASSVNLDNCSQIECAIVGVSELMSFCSPFTEIKESLCKPMNIPQVDFGTFAPLLGTKFFCFSPSSLSLVTEEINSYLTCPLAGINFDFNEENHSWKCSETKDFETVTFAISLYQSSTNDKIYVKFHRLSGPCGVFSDSVARFSCITSIAHSLMTVDPVDLSETCISAQSEEQREGCNPKKRKGGFRALPLPLTIRQKTTTSREFISYCEVFNIWAQSDIQECLSSILSSMPKMWKDLTLFYKNVEDMAALNAAGSEEATKEMVQMFNAMNKIYKNIFAIAVNAYHALHADEAEQQITLATVAPVAVEEPVYVAPEVDYSGHLDSADSRYAFLDFDDEDVDLSAGRVDDFHFGRDASANNQLNRHAVTMDITKSGYRSMAVFERSEQQASGAYGGHVMQVDSAKSESHVSVISTNHKKIVVMEHDAHSLFGKLVAASSALAAPDSGAATDAHHLAEVLGSRSKEDLSSILYLSLACVCHQFSPENAVPGTTFAATKYLSAVVNHNQDFVLVLADLLSREQSACALLAAKGHGYNLFNSKEIAQCAQQLNADIQ